ncbi:NAD(P)-dependent oxidoreductase [Olivibacter sp. XZL3]|uniref:NAD(P)-dependent oxidoreductase n=1 Tax=Olivibacter sp. XZL3 TaxID=1735116 RepID=UPI001066622D|nr:NAD(P)-dependent oxidoreductase [Olivibacter sp. XZL3]
MKIALIGATGFVGGAVLQELLLRGVEVTALVRNPTKLTLQNEKLHKVEVDVLDTETFVKAIQGFDLIISAYNADWTNPNLYTDFLAGSKAIQEGVKKAGVKRLLVIGGAGSLYVAEGLQLVDTPEFPADWKPGATAARDYLNILKEEKEIDWVFLSPAPEMHQGLPRERKGLYRVGTDHPVADENGRSWITVDDLAVAIVDEALHPKHSKQRFTVAY